MIILDRYEGDFAVLEIDGKIKKLPVSMLGKNIPEGSVLKIEDNLYILDEENTKIRKEKLKKLQNQLFN